jgi:hypothetical protein
LLLQVAEVAVVAALAQECTVVAVELAERYRTL